VRFHTNRLLKVLSVPRRALLDLEELPLDCPHSRHQPVQFGKKLLLILPGLLDRFVRGPMADAVKGIGEPAVEKPHVMLQVQKLLVKLSLLEHGRDLT
jgi:hypothetical protein